MQSFLLAAHRDWLIGLFAVCGEVGGLLKTLT